jgi:hypothetical protein
MNVRQSGTSSRTFLLGVMVMRLAALCAPALAQTNQSSGHDPVNAFVGTWTAKAQGESTPFLVLKLHEGNGKLTGTMSHFKIGVTRNGTITGNPVPGESPVADLTVGDGDLRFVWGEPPLGGDEAKFVLEGTRKAQVVIIVSPEQMQEIRAANPRAAGFNPVIYVSRETASDNQKQTERSAEEKLEAGIMARLIDTAEAQYKFAHGTYASYETLLSSGQLKKTGGREFALLPRNLQSETDPLPGYRLRLLISHDGNSYQLSIQEKTADCGAGLFSDETGVIFEGHALDRHRCGPGQEN